MGNRNTVSVLTAREVAKKWNISARRVSRLCQDGRIVGATKTSGGFWLVPASAEKPVDARKKKGDA